MYHCRRGRASHDRLETRRGARSKTRRVLARPWPHEHRSAPAGRLGRIPRWSLSSPCTCYWEARQMKTKKRVVGRQFGPERHQFDPYDAMTNKEFEAEVIAALDAAKHRQKAISIKLPEALLERTREEAKRRGVPYQTLIKILLERSLDRLGAA